MATPKKSKPTKEEPKPTKLIVEKNLFKQQLNERIRIGQEIHDRNIQSHTQLEEAKRDKSNWDNYNSELLKQSFNNESNEYKLDYDKVNFYYGMIGGKPANAFIEFQEKLQRKLTNLRQLVEVVDLLKSDTPEKSSESFLHREQDFSSNNNVFIVHGHNTEVIVKVARTLEKLGFNPIILNEQANAGRTLIEKFEENSNVGFAIILLTDDDLGKAKIEEDLKPRARQNVILELGYFIGKLGRSRVCPLYTKGVELPSDLHGLAYIEIDSSDHWKIKIVKELKTAGYDVDANKII